MSHAELLEGAPYRATSDTQASQTQNDVPPVVIVGAGPVGIRAAQELVRRGIAVTILGEEPYDPYNRVRLTPLLGGDVQFGEIALQPPSGDGIRFETHAGRRVVSIDRTAKHVVTGDGTVWPYAHLILATGSRAFVPGIPGRDLAGVYTFRTAADASALVARSISARRVAVIGGGLLGLEAARGMRRRQCEVTVIEHEDRLLPRQLAGGAAGLLAGKIRELGVEVRTQVAVREILGAHKVTGLSLSDGGDVPCDTVIICTGVRANTDLAQGADLAFNRGIIVDDRMQTVDPAIFAVGECIEHDGMVYGLVGPGYAQADVAAAAIAGEPARFEVSAPATKLKVIGADVFSVGEVEKLEVKANVRSETWERDGCYRRIFIERGRVVGALAVGEWDQTNRVQDAVQSGAKVYPWMLYRFRKNGVLWPDEELPVVDLPATATICNCTGVNCGQLRAAMAGGAKSVVDFGAETGAGTVCGSCHPLMEELLDAGGPPKPLPLWQVLTGFSAIAIVAAALPLIFGYVPLPASYDAESLRMWLWRDNIVKQWSGFILLGITLSAMLIGLRKRIRLMDYLGSYDAWRLVHIFIGLLALAGIYAHTGFRLGANLNFALGACFAATLIFGAIAGLATGGDHALRARRIGSARTPPRKLPTWVHIFAVWPLPVLILIHVLTAYAF